ncbi:mucin-2-like [Diachasmimorpha longicaudata]|uniref:mucin-2-like n=1 Tax=Diachasmimorpha longicaudata TaxID=58733 RepID=UPI0030B8D4A8
MDVTGPIEHSVASKKVKHKFFQWTTKWCYAHVDQSTEKPDVASVVCLLQALGCQLREYEKNNNPADELKSNSLKIVLECGTSRMRAVLELDDVNCQCLRPEDAKDASLWSVCGRAPTASCESINKFEETGSNLLPQVSKDDRAMIHDVLCHLLETINFKSENQNKNSTFNLSSSKTSLSSSSSIDKSEAFTRALTQPEIYRLKEGRSIIRTPSEISLTDRHLSMSIQNIANLIETTPTPPSTKTPPRLQRQMTWGMDSKSESEPRPSPPKISSSPVVLSDLCTSLGQVSLPSDDETLNLTECLRRIKFYTDKALILYRRCSPLPDNDNAFVKTKIVKPKASPGRVNLTSSSINSSPGSLSSSRLTIQKPMTRRSIGAPVTSKQMSVLKTTPTKLSPRRQSIGSTFQPGMKLAIAGSLKNTTIQKKIFSKPSPSTSSNSSLLSVDSRGLPTKRRISPDPKSHSPLVNKPGLAHLKTLTPKAPGGGNRSLSGIPLGTAGHAACVPGSSSRTDGSNTLGRKTAIGGSKLPTTRK